MVVHDSERHVIHFKAVGEVTDVLSISISVGDSYDLCPLSVRVEKKTDTMHKLCVVVLLMEDFEG